MRAIEAGAMHYNELHEHLTRDHFSPEPIRVSAASSSFFFSVAGWLEVVSGSMGLLPSWLAHTLKVLFAFIGQIVEIVLSYLPEPLHHLVHVGHHVLSHPYILAAAVIYLVGVIATMLYVVRKRRRRQDELKKLY